jgi:hypothetical protein
MLRDRSPAGWPLADRSKRLFFDIQETAQHVVRSFYGLEIGFKPSLADDLIDGFFTEVDVRQF